MLPVLTHPVRLSHGPTWFHGHEKCRRFVAWNTGVPSADVVGGPVRSYHSSAIVRPEECPGRDLTTDPGQTDSADIVHAPRSLSHWISFSIAISPCTPMHTWFFGPMRVWRERVRRACAFAHAGVMGSDGRVQSGCRAIPLLPLDRQTKFSLRTKNRLTTASTRGKPPISINWSSLIKQYAMDPAFLELLQVPI
jgi:hypothetical protein